MSHESLHSETHPVEPNPLGLSAIVFDFGGTLDFPGIAWYERLFGYSRQLDRELTWETFLPVARNAGDALAEQADAGNLSMEETVQRLVKFIVTAEVSPKLRDQTNSMTSWFLDESYAHLEESRVVLETLSRHFRMACISNNWGNALGWCEDYELDGFFEFVIDSAAVGFRKPDLRIFQPAIERLGLPAASIGYVGDQFKADVLGSKSAGMKSIWYVGEREKPCPDESLVDYRIRHLSELRDWVSV